MESRGEEKTMSEENTVKLIEDFLLRYYGRPLTERERILEGAAFLLLRDLVEMDKLDLAMLEAILQSSAVKDIRVEQHYEDKKKCVKDGEKLIRYLKESKRV